MDGQIRDAEAAMAIDSGSGPADSSCDANAGAVGAKADSLLAGHAAERQGDGVSHPSPPEHLSVIGNVEAHVTGCQLHCAY